MGWLIGVAEILVVVWIVSWIRRVWRSRPVPHPARRLAARPPAAPPAGTRSRGPDVLGGWWVGHAVADGREDYPGDPFPNGHFGSPADLAFWGTVFDDEDEDLD